MNNQNKATHNPKLQENTLQSEIEPQDSSNQFHQGIEKNDKMFQAGKYRGSRSVLGIEVNDQIVSDESNLSKQGCSQAEIPKPPQNSELS